MTYFARRGEVEISRLHNVAICKEISERLAVGMKPEPSGMPPLLIMLMRRLRDKPISPLPAHSRASHGRRSHVEMTNVSGGAN